MVKILVLGSTGMLGHMVYYHLSKEHNFRVDGTIINDKSSLFYFNAEASLEKLEEICNNNGGYDYFINCIGITQNKIGENSSDSIIRGIKINTLFPHILSALSEGKNIRVIHISTDGVFSSNHKDLDESQPSDCTDMYGKMKSLGEVFNNKKFINFRCSIIGPSPYEKGGLLEWFLSQPSNSVIPGFTNQYWKGATTLQFAELCSKIIKDDIFDELRTESAVLHFAPNQAVTKYELLNIFKEVYQREIRIEKRKASAYVRRNLISNYAGVKKIIAHGISMKKAIQELSRVKL